MCFEDYISECGIDIVNRNNQQLQSRKQKHLTNCKTPLIVQRIIKTIQNKQAQAELGKVQVKLEAMEREHIT